MILMVGALFHRLVLIVNIATFPGVFNLWCNMQAEETTRMQILQASFTTLLNSKNLKNDILCFNTTQAIYVQ